jgi:hypothetical protein
VKTSTSLAIAALTKHNNPNKDLLNIFPFIVSKPKDVELEIDWKSARDSYLNSLK